MDRLELIFLVAFLALCGVTIAVAVDYSVSCGEECSVNERGVMVQRWPSRIPECICVPHQAKP